MKPIKVSCGSFVVDSNFNVILFTERQAAEYARITRKQLSKSIGHTLKKHKVKDCGEYYTCSFA